MRKLTTIISISLGFYCQLNAQLKDSLVKGNVSYISTKNVYAKFESTKSIETGDTLYIRINNLTQAAIIVTNKSSTSCVGVPLNNLKLIPSAEIFYKYKTPLIPDKQKTELPEESPVYLQEPIVESKSTPGTKLKNEVWKGRISLASYSGFSNDGEKPSHRFQYTLSLNGNNIRQSAFSLESYLSFRHKADEWYRVREDINYALKIYALALKWQVNPSMEISLGRKINYRLSSMGVIDGIQIEKSFNQFSLGAVCGSRPDPFNYGLNLKFFEVGIFAAYNWNINQDFNSQNTLAFVDQQNHGNTDRRFIHFQHSSTLFSRLSMFGSMEIDLYEKINEQETNTFRLTNLYFTMRYRFSRKLNISVSYDARSDIIYYETYKNTIDSLLEYETRQGLRLQINVQPLRYVSLGCSGNLRFQKGNFNESKNLNVYIIHNRIPWIHASLNLNANYLKTNYLNSTSFGLNLSRDLVGGLLSGEIYARRVEYSYAGIEFTQSQKLLGFNLTCRVNKMISMNLYCEKTFDQFTDYLRLNARAMLRF